LVVKRHLRTRLEQSGAAVLLATHALDIVEHYADRAGLLLDGRLKREWQKKEIQELRTSGRGFDAALAATYAP
jgi:ABC-2 type transport system ATP-binding protein